ncbi:17-beta-hydroxysteroid dehydrogenase type 6-like [Alligator mississippiensis]|uniref:17-beta-hydroxysteroid dehydrogenase type 6-like n=1 Tax=Alligator mississippiensis TaxID=8496 RepID=UPI002877CC0B|nr:17-beta-hydroxysteroid dehydrogenase type 6-like [Alligator mississippiensis]
MWVYLAALLALYFLRRWYRERQTVGNLPDKHVFITGCGSGFGHLLAKQLDGRGLRVLAACLTEQGAERLQQETSGRLQTVILDVTKSDSIHAATAWVMGQARDKGEGWLCLLSAPAEAWALEWGSGARWTTQGSLDAFATTSSSSPHL